MHIDLFRKGGTFIHGTPLISGHENSVHRAGISVQNKVVSERDAGDLEDHIIEIDEISHE